MTMSNAEQHAQAAADRINGVPTMMHVEHAERLEYGWWERKRGRIFLPKTLGQKNNFVLTHEELAAYDACLVDMHMWIDEERKRTSNTLTVLRKGLKGHLISVTEPTCFTIAHVLEGMVRIARFELATMNVLGYIAKERVSEQRRNDEDHESQVGADP